MGLLIAILVLMVWLVMDVYWAALSLLVGILVLYAQNVLGVHQASAGVIVSVVAAMVFEVVRQRFAK